MATPNNMSDRSQRGSRFLWQIIMDEILTRIRSGKLQPGQKIPTEKELAEYFEVNANTVRRALAKMQDLGVLQGERGRGVFVREDIVRYPIGVKQQQSAELNRLHRANLRQVLGAKTVRPSADIASALCIPSDSYVRRIETLTWVDSRPFSLATYYYPLPRFHDIDLKIKSYGSITKALHDFEVDEYRRIHAVIRPWLLTAREANLLQQKRSKPSLKVRHVNVAPDGTPIQVGISIEASWVELIVRFDHDNSIPPVHGGDDNIG